MPRIYSNPSIRAREPVSSQERRFKIKRRKTHLPHLLPLSLQLRVPEAQLEVCVAHVCAGRESEVGGQEKGDARLTDLQVWPTFESIMMSHAEELPSAERAKKGRGSTGRKFPLLSLSSHANSSSRYGRKEELIRLDTAREPGHARFEGRVEPTCHSSTLTSHELTLPYSHSGPRQVSLFSSELREPRRKYLKAAAWGIFCTTICLWAVLPIYWGAYYRQSQNLYRLTIGLIDLDTPGAQAAGLSPTLGPALLRGPSLIQEKYHLEYVVIDNTQFDISSATGGSARGVDVHHWAQETMHNEDYFGMIVGESLAMLRWPDRADADCIPHPAANANATVAASSAFQSLIGGSNGVQYMGNGALSLYINEGRNILTYDQVSLPALLFLS